jgi:hypothetical protein
VTDNDRKRLPNTPQNTPQDSDLAVVIGAWHTLPEAVRASILMLVKAAGK